MDDTLMNRDRRFLQSAYLRNLFPLMFSIFGGTINALVDSVLVSQKMGRVGLAAVNVSMPVYLALCTLGTLTAGGASVLSAQAMGREDAEEARKYYHSAWTLALLLGVVVMVSGVCLARPLAWHLAQDDRLARCVYAYCLVTFMGAVPAIMVYFPMFYLQLEGKADSITRMISVMILLDAFLDVLFLFVFPFGLYGAAAASVLSTLAAWICGWTMLGKDGGNYRFDRKLLGLYGTGRILRNGSPTAMGNFWDALRLLLLNIIILRAGGTQGAAIWAVLNTLSELSLAISSGVPQAAAPMTGVYYAAKDNGGIRILVRLQATVGSALSFGYTVFLILCCPLISGLFQVSSPLRLPLFCLGGAVAANTIGSIWMALFTETERIALSNVMAACFRFLFPVAAAGCLAITKGYLWLFLPLGAAMAVLTGAFLVSLTARRSRKGKYPLSAVLLLDDHLERENKILDFSIAADMKEACHASAQIGSFCQANDMDAKQIMRMSLAIEELIQVLIHENQGIQVLELRAYALDGVAGIQIRCAGRRYDPFDHVDEDDELFMGVRMLIKMAGIPKYTYTLGINTIHIYFAYRDGGP